VRIPLSKPHLATALALEWDQLTSAQEATRQHLVPLTSLICRALDLADDDARLAAQTESPATPAIRTSIATVLIRYLDTDSLLCWAPHTDIRETTNDAGQSLRGLQEATAQPIVDFLTTHVWPGIELEPVLDGESIVPRGQKPGVREAVHSWILRLEHWELVALERAVLAGKGVLGAVRLLVEWSEGPAGVGATRGDKGQTEVFGVEEAARAASVEVSWQTGRWGEVEDTHDVEKEDLRRQLGSVVLLVSGTGKTA
jgi:ATP synthase F1 complex assembly factor 2